jgi:hypothetical protein
MPTPFARFRLLNNGRRVQNMNPDKSIYVQEDEAHEAIEVPPKGELDVPFAEDFTAVVFVNEPE